MRIGAHVSIAAGPERTVAYAAEVGCECIQVFAKSPRQWRGPAQDEGAAAVFAQTRAAASIAPLFTHTAYLINLSTDDVSLREKSIEALADELVRGSLLGADGVVTHIGNDPANDPRRAAERVAGAVLGARTLAGQTDEGPALLLENTAGAGTTYGGSFEELAGVFTRLDGVGLPPTGFCLDTCHLFAHGVDLTTPDGWASALDALESAFGPDRVGLVHANDSMFPRGSRRDRHAWIGEGEIGSYGFAAMLCEPRLRDVPAIVEMPGEKPEKDAVNVARLKTLRDSCEGSSPVA